MRILTLIVVTITYFLSITCAEATERVALVIGNGDYNKRGWSLKNPERDAKLIAQSLEDIGFSVTLRLNLTEKEMENEVKKHSVRLNEAGNGSIGFVYYAGHAIQSEGSNYLLPVDSEAETEQDVWSDSLRLGLLLRLLDSAGNRVNFIVLDACRDNPLPSESRSLFAGLSSPDQTTGMLIAYATAPGAKAKDGRGKNSPYASALASVIKTDGLIAEQVFKLVADKVYVETDGKQRPYYSNGLTGEDICFADCDQSISNIKLESDLVEFKSAKTPCDYKSFVEKRPSSSLAVAAQQLSVGCIREGEFAVIDERSRSLAAVRSPAKAKRVHTLAREYFRSGKYEKSLGQFEKGCELGYPQSCFEAAKFYTGLNRYYPEQHVASVDDEKSFSLFLRGCELGDVAACALGQQFFESGHAELKPNHKYSEILAKLGCEKGIAGSCGSWAELIESGTSETNDLQLVRSLYETACKSKATYYCSSLATMKDFGIGGVKSRSEAKELLDRACANGRDSSQCKSALFNAKRRGAISLVNEWEG